MKLLKKLLEMRRKNAPKEIANIINLYGVLMG
jgi:hypothetical protein